MGFLACCASGWAGPAAIAQESMDVPSDDWRFSAGLGVVSHPQYPGSSDTKTSTLPSFSANYGRYFIGGLTDAGVPFGVGANIIQNDHWRLGVGLGIDTNSPRQESDSSHLQGMGDIDATTRGALFASYSQSWWIVAGNLVTDLGGKDQGSRGALELEVSYHPTQRLELSAGPGIAWADSKYNQTFFGVTVAQSARSGLPSYTADAGINALNFNIGARYALSPQWGLGARFTASSLRGDAGDSPITQQKSQNTFGAFLNYRFR